MSQHPSQSKDTRGQAKPAVSSGRNWKLGLVGIPAGWAAALLFDNLTRMILEGALSIDTSRLRATLMAFFFAEWFVLAVLFLWKARDIGTVLSRSLLFASLEWFAVASSSLVLGARLLPTSDTRHILDGFSFLYDTLAHRTRVFFQMNALLGFILGGVFLLAAFLVFRETYQRS